jgi:hypothetical protein
MSDILEHTPRLEAVSAFVQEHGFATRVTEGAVEALIPWSRRTADGFEGGEEWTRMGRTMAEAREGLGY